MNILISLRDGKNFSEVEETLKDYILKNKEIIPNISIHELANRTYTSPATIVRLSQKLGLSGFSEFKNCLIKDLASLKIYGLDVNDETNILRNDNPQSIINKLTRITIHSIEETQMFIDEKKIMEIAQKISKAAIIDIFGIGSSNVVAYDAAIKFSRIGKNIIYYQNEASQIIQAKNADPNHIGIIISFSGESPQILEVATALKENDVEFITITKNAINSLQKMSKYNLYVSSKESLYRSSAVTSRTATLYLLDIIYNICVVLDFDNTTNSINKTIVMPKK